VLATEKLRSDLARVGRVSLMGELSASLAHELNQPLSAIALNAQAVRRMLDRDDMNRADICSALDDIVADGRRASAVIGRVRALFRNEAAVRRPLDVNEVIADVAALVRDDVARHGITFTFAPARSLPRIHGDVIQVQQVILNVLVNACEALGAVGTGPRVLTVTTARREPRHVHISVRDTGVGVEDPETEHLFAPFVSSKPDRLGMGLAISRSVVESHGGRIWADRNDDRGLTVHVVLPDA
jgi:signal transduction histidine kinase